MASTGNATPALILKLQELQHTLTKSEQRVTNFIIENPEQVINLSVAALAEQVRVSDPTVVRACQKLGFSGYQDLKVTLAQSIVTPLQNINEEIQPGDDVQKMVGKVFNSTIHTLQYTYETLDTAAIEQAAKYLMGARRIAIFGVGASGAIASDLQHKLQRLNLNAQAYVDPHLQAMSAAYLTEADVVLAISHSGSSRVVVDNVRIARENGAKVISLTNIGRSPLSKLADVSLFTASQETKFRILAISSRIAELTILDCIYTYIALHTDGANSMKVEKAMENLKY